MPILTGCTPGYIVNGQRVTDQELAQYQAVWKPGTLELATKSAVAAKEHQGILNLIAALEARGATRDRPCRDLTLTDIVSRRPATVSGNQFFEFSVTSHERA